MKRGQVQGEIFVYVMSAIVLVLVVIYGYGAVNQIRQSASQAEMQDFKLDLVQEIKRTSNSYGRVTVLNIKSPQSIRTICFIDTLTNSCPEKIVGDYKNDAGADLSQNIFLLGEGIETLYAQGVKTSGVIPSPCVCIEPTSGRFRARLESTGDGVIVEAPPRS